MKRLFYFFLPACLLWATCGGNSAPATAEVTWNISPDRLTLPKQESSAYIDVTVNAEWSVTSSAEWCTSIPQTGHAGNTRVKITAAPNYTNSERTATLTFKSGDYTHGYTVTQQESGETEIITLEGYTMVWNDEFNDQRSSGGKAALPNTAEWKYETGSHGWGNNELQNYISAVQGNDTCASVYDGTLKIVARKRNSEVLSVRMNTKKNWLYGYFEARIKLPSGKGTWPAFWMLPANFVTWPDDGEIDIMEEVGYRPNWVSAAIHCKAYNHSINTQKTAEKFVATAESAFHVYGLEWTPDYIRGFVDKEKYFEFANDKQGNKNTWPFNVPFYLKLNLAWGGNWGGSQGVDESALPATYEIDYVRVFQKEE
jgi:beta-glucanase (GH16 family)